MTYIYLSEAADKLAELQWPDADALPGDNGIIARFMAASRNRAEIARLLDANKLTFIDPANRLSKINRDDAFDRDPLVMLDEVQRLIGEQEPAPVEQSAPAAKVEAETVTTLGDTAAYDEKLAALFDPVTKEALEKTFPANGQWKIWAERAARNGLRDAAKEGRSMFNPYKAAVWFVNQGIDGWDLARCLRAVVKILPARSRNEKFLLTGDID